MRSELTTELHAPAVSIPAVEFHRGDRLESLHNATAVACDADGRVVFSMGDPNRIIFPRSGLKPFQALVPVGTGSLRQREIAVACSSHSAEPDHVALVQSWLDRLGLDEQSLICGPQIPYDAPVSKALFLSGEVETRLHNNCSGKHTGMLAACAAKGWTYEGYHAPDHPAQRAITQTLDEITGGALDGPPEIDGCAAPTFAMSISGAARAFARLADQTDAAGGHRATLDQVFDAMRAHPWLVGGTDRSCTDFMAACPDVVAKMGAEGFYGLALRRLGLGVAVKVDDGTERGGQIAAGAILEALSAVAPDHADAVARWTHKRLKNSAGDIVGHAGPSRRWLDGVAK